MSNPLKKCITALDYTDKILLALLSASSGVPLFSFTTVIGQPVRIESANIIQVLFITNVIYKMVFKTI